MSCGQRRQEMAFPRRKIFWGSMCAGPIVPSLESECALTSLLVRTPSKSYSLFLLYVLTWAVPEQYPFWSFKRLPFVFNSSIFIATSCQPSFLSNNS